MPLSAVFHTSSIQKQVAALSDCILPSQENSSIATSLTAAIST